jgi:RecA-family ATPase
VPVASCCSPPRTHYIVRRRLEGISAAASVALADLDIQVITAPTVRLDLDADRRNLAETVARLQPRLLILDPFVRLHRIDENASGEVAPLLAYLRELQRQHDVAVLVVHHAKKASAPVRRCAAPRSSTPGVIPTSTCAATAMISRCRSSIVPRHR